MKITHIIAQEVLDSRGNPTVEAAVVLENGMTSLATVPSGASTGIHEALELRDGDPARYLGLGVQKTVDNVNTKIAPVLIGMEINMQQELDNKMIVLDGTSNKSNLGANGILAVSLACAKAAAVSLQKPLYECLSSYFGEVPQTYTMPVPMVNVLNGGKHAAGSTDFQEFMIIPVGAPSMVEAVRWGSEVFHHLGKIIKTKGWSTLAGDEGGYAVALASNEEPFALMLEAITNAGYTLGKDVAIAIDPAASTFYENGNYILKTENRTLTSQQMVDMYAAWVERYPLVSLEDGLAEDDWAGWTALTARVGDKIQVVGDDLYATNVTRLQRGIAEKASNSILIKVNQIGTLTETIAAIQLAKSANMTAVVSHRSGETEDTFIADLVVAAGTGQIKTGSMSRSERVAKYNRLMSIERELGTRAVLGGFPYKR